MGSASDILSLISSKRAAVSRSRSRPCAHRGGDCRQGRCEAVILPTALSRKAGSVAAARVPRC